MRTKTRTAPDPSRPSAATTKPSRPHSSAQASVRQEPDWIGAEEFGVFNRPVGDFETLDCRAADEARRHHG